MPGNVIAVDYSENNGGSFTTYYYLRNAQGDVVKLIDKTGSTVVEYTYDTWGKLLSTTGSLAETFGEEQPFRYRGYVYDEETGFYYVSSRYYDPEIGRWISPEPNVDNGEFDEGAGLIGYNVYAYCANNPVMYKDDTGESITLCILIGAGIGLIAGGVFGAYRANKNGYSPSDKMEVLEVCCWLWCCRRRNWSTCWLGSRSSNRQIRRGNRSYIYYQRRRCKVFVV